MAVEEQEEEEFNGNLVDQTHRGPDSTRESDLHLVVEEDEGQTMARLHADRVAQ